MADLKKEMIAALVEQVLYAIAEKQQKDDYVIVVYTGATAGFSEGLIALERVLLSGMKLRILCSEMSSYLYGDVLKKRILNWPGTEVMEQAKWLTQLRHAKGVIVPSLSVAALGKVTSLIADSVATNLILQSLFMGKNPIIAIDGVLPGNEERKQLGLDSTTPALRQAVTDRLQLLAGFGATLCHSTELCSLAVNSTASVTSPEITTQPVTKVPKKQISNAVIDAATVRAAVRNAQDINAAKGAVITPLAHEIACRHGITINRG